MSSAHNTPFGSIFFVQKSSQSAKSASKSQRPPLAKFAVGDCWACRWRASRAKGLTNHTTHSRQWVVAQSTDLTFGEDAGECSYRKSLNVNSRQFQRRHFARFVVGGCWVCRRRACRAKGLTTHTATSKQWVAAQSTNLAKKEGMTSEHSLRNTHQQLRKVLDLSSAGPPIALRA